MATGNTTYVMALEYNSGDGKWEPVAGVSPADFNMSIPSSGVTTHPHRFITQVTHSDVTYDYDQLTGVTLNSGSPAVFDPAATTESINVRVPTDAVGGTADLNILSTKLEINNTTLTSGLVGHYTLLAYNSFGYINHIRAANVTAVTRDQTRVEVVYYNTGTSHWITRQGADSDDYFDFPAATTNWELPIKYVRHIKVFDTIDVPTGTGTTIEGYGNITNWYQVDLSVTGSWFTGAIAAYTIYDASNTIVSTDANLLTLTSDGATHADAQNTVLILAVNPYAPTGLVNKTYSVSATAKTSVAISTSVLAPADNNNTYNFALEIAGGDASHTWSATGLPTGYTINAQTGVITNSGTRNQLTQGTTDVSVVITYTYTNPINYLPYTVTKSFTFYQFALQIRNNGNLNTLPIATVGSSYDNTTPVHQEVTVVGNIAVGATASNYNSNKPGNWNGTNIYGTFTTNYNFGSGFDGIGVYSAAILASVPDTSISIVIANLANGDPLPKPAGFGNFSVARLISLPTTTSSKSFDIFPTAITTRAEITTGGRSQDTIGIQMNAGVNFASGTSRYQLTNSDGLFSGVYPIGATVSTSDPTTWNSGLAIWEFIWLPLNISATSGEHTIIVWREGVPKPFIVTIDNSILTGSTTQISNVGFPGYSDLDPTTVSITPYSLYQAAIASGSPATDIAQTFTVVVKQTSPHIIPVIGAWQLVPNGSSTALDYICLDGSNPTVVVGNSCTVKFKSTIPVMAANYDETAFLIFNTFADGSEAGTRRALIHVKKSHSTFDILPTTLSPVVGTLVSQQFTNNSTHLPVTYSVTNVNSTLFPNFNMTAGGLFTSDAPPSSTPSFSFDVHALDSSGGIANQQITGNISTSGPNPTIDTNGVNPSTFDKDTITPIVITGTNFGTGTSANSVVISVAVGVNSSLTIQSATSTQINCTYNASVGAIGSYSLVVTKLSSGASAFSTVTLTSNFTGVITSVDTPTPNTANSSVSLTVHGYNLGTAGQIGYKPSGSSSAPTQYAATVTGGTTATATGINLGPQGTASVYFFSTSGSQASGVLPLTIAAGGVGTITLTDGSTPYTGSSVEGSPTPVPVARNVSKTFTLSAGVSNPIWSLGTSTLPLGLILNFDVGTITGTVTDSSVSTTFSLTATSGASTKTVWFRFNLTGGTLSMSAQIINLHQGQNSVSKIIQTSGGVSPLTFRLDTTDFPLGSLVFDTVTGTFSGNVSLTASKRDYINSVRVTDSATTPVSVSANITLRVLDPLTNPVINYITPTIGSYMGGTPVTLDVTDIHPSFVVKIDGIVASVTTTSLSSFAGKITVTSPAHALGNVLITVTNTDDQVSTPVPFTYSAVVRPTFSSLDPLRDGPFGGGQQLKIFGSDFATGMTVKIDTEFCTGWDHVANVQWISTTEAHITTPAYAGTLQTTPPTAVHVSITLANGGEQNTIDDAYTYRPPPTISAIVPPTGPSGGNTTIYITGQNFFQVGLTKPRVFIGSYEIPQESITLK
jgi:hypothetical protein